MKSGQRVFDDNDADAASAADDDVEDEEVDGVDGAEGMEQFSTGLLRCRDSTDAMSSSKGKTQKENGEWSVRAIERWQVMKAMCVPKKVEMYETDGKCEKKTERERDRERSETNLL